MTQILKTVENTSKYLGKLFSNVTTYKDGFKIDPQILHNQPVLYNVRCIR